MNDGFITKPIAKAIKTLGYDKPCFNYYLSIYDYVHGKDFKKNWNEWPSYSGCHWFSAPTWVDLSQWLWDKHQMWVEIWPDGRGFCTGIKGLKASDETESSISLRLDLAFIFCMGNIK